MPTNDGFFSRVYQVVRLIPAGKVTSYGAIAAYVGSPGAGRMVGWAMNKSYSLDDFIPAHRVLNRFGALTGKHAFPGSDTMQQLLESEGLKVEKNQVVDFNDHFWDPSRELLPHYFG
jgi:methylated-DNA-protein-cysteine methyltransferase-like protein